MDSHPSPHNLLAASTLAAMGAHDRMGNEDRTHWLIERPVWALSPGQYMLAVSRQQNGRYIVVIGHQGLDGQNVANVQQENVIDLDVDEAAQQLWWAGPSVAEVIHVAAN